MLLSLRRNGLTSLFKEVRVFKESSSKVGFGGNLKVGQKVGPEVGFPLYLYMKTYFRTYFLTYFEYSPETYF